MVGNKLSKQWKNGKETSGIKQIIIKTMNSVSFYNKSLLEKYSLILIWEMENRLK